VHCLVITAAKLIISVTSNSRSSQAAADMDDDAGSCLDVCVGFSDNSCKSQSRTAPEAALVVDRQQ
jgi:hypothetical protein